MHLADTLSRALLPDIPIATEEPEDVPLVEERRGEAARDVESIDMLQFVAVSEESLALIRQAMACNPIRP